MKERKDNSGALFANDRKQNDRQPTHTGSCLIGGKEFYISAWVKESAGGKRFFSLAFKVKEQRQAEGATEPDLNDPIPF